MPPNEVLNQEISAHCATLALEAETGNEGFASAISQLPTLVGKMRNLLSLTTFSPIKTLFGSERYQIPSKMKSRTYLDFSAVSVIVPAGLQTSYMDYQGKLLAAARVVSGADNTLYAPFEAWLGRGLGSPSSLSSVMSTLRIDSKKLNTQLDTLERDIAGCFVTKGSRLAEAPYTTALQNQKQWDDVITGCEELRGIFTAERQKATKKRLDNIDILLDRLIVNIENKPDLYALSPNSLREIASVCDLVARHLEYYAITRNRSDEYLHAIKTTMEKLKKF